MRSIEIGGIENPILAKMVAHSVADCIAAVSENEKQILSDIAEMREDQDDDKALKFKASLSITLDLDKSVVETKFSYSVKRLTEGSHRLDEDENPMLPFDAKGGD